MAEDIAGDRGTAGQLALDRPVEGAIDAVADTDWFAVQLVRGVTYTFIVEPVAAGGVPLGDPTLTVHDSEGTPLDAGGMPAKFGAEIDEFSFTPFKTGLYFVQVNSLSSEQLGEYRLSVTAPSVSIAALAAGEGNENSTTVHMHLVLSAPLADPVTVTLRSLNGTAIAGEDFKGLDIAVTIPAGDTEAEIPLVLLGDAVSEHAEHFFVAIADISGGAAIMTDQATVTIVDDDPDPAFFIDGETRRGTASADTILAGNGGDAVDGSDGADLLFGLGGPDLLRGGAGDDFVLGDFPEADGGNDSLLGEDGNDVLFAGAGDDTALGLGGSDTLVGEAGDDRLEGGAGFNLLFGNDGADLLLGGAQEDYLFGEGGADRLDAGGGNDRVHVDGADIFATGGDGIFDVLVVTGPGIAAIDLGDPVNQNEGIAGPVLTGFEVVDASLAPQGVVVIGARLNGNGNVLIGSSHGDLLVGSHAVDIIAGGPESDTLEGLAGDDTIIADGGDDFLMGHEGRDAFRFTGAAGTVEIVDFAQGEDRIEIPASLGLDAKQIIAGATDLPDGAAIPLTAALSIRLVGYAADALLADDFWLY